MYSPIMNWKLGEKNAIAYLAPEVRAEIMPIICVDSFGSNPLKFSDSMSKILHGGPFYLYLGDALVEDELKPYSEFETLMNGQLRGQYVPVIDVSNHFIFSDALSVSTNGLAFRVRNEEFEDALGFIGFVCDEYSVELSQIDLILDFEKIKPENFFTYRFVVREFLSSNESIKSFRRIIVSSTSFPSFTELSSIEAYQVTRFKRYELELFELCRSQNPDLDLVYSDYGPFGTETLSPIPGMSPNFKIRYTTDIDYAYIRGVQLKKGGLELDKVKRCCDEVVNLNEFKGSDFSWADNFINRISSGENISAGNLTTWVTVGWNHHITQIINKKSG